MTPKQVRQSVEAALKIARQVKGRPNVISFTHGFHGVSGGSLAVTANMKFRDASGYALGNTTFTWPARRGVPWAGITSPMALRITAPKKLLPVPCLP